MWDRHKYIIVFNCFFSSCQTRKISKVFPRILFIIRKKEELIELEIMENGVLKYSVRKTQMDDRVYKIYVWYININVV